MTTDTSRTLDCGKSIEELSEYLAADRSPHDPTIETCPECLNALQVLGSVAGLSRDLLAQDAADLPEPPANWLHGIMTNIRNEVRAGRSLPLHHPDPRVTLSVTEGAIRALIRTVGDKVPGVVVGRCTLDGDLEKPDAPVSVTVSASVGSSMSILDSADALRVHVREALLEHTELNVRVIDVIVEDLHGFGERIRDEITKQEQP